MIKKYFLNTLFIFFIFLNTKAQTWAALGLGVNATVHAVTTYNGDLIVGRQFTVAGGAPANYIAKWNGIAWSPLGTGMDGEVDALCVYNGELFAGG